MGRLWFASRALRRDECSSLVPACSPAYGVRVYSRMITGVKVCSSRNVNSSSSISRRRCAGSSTLRSFAVGRRTCSGRSSLCSGAKSACSSSADLPVHRARTKNRWVGAVWGDYREGHTHRSHLDDDFALHTHGLRDASNVGCDHFVGEGRGTLAPCEAPGFGGERPQRTHGAHHQIHPRRISHGNVHRVLAIRHRLAFGAWGLRQHSAHGEVKNRVKHLSLVLADGMTPEPATRGGGRPCAQGRSACRWCAP